MSVLPFAGPKTGDLAIEESDLQLSKSSAPQPSPAGPEPSGRRPRWRPRTRLSLIIWVLLLSYFFVFPLGMLVVSAFRTSPLDPHATWTLSGFVDVFTSPDTLGALWTSFVYAGVTAVLGMAIAIYFVTIATRVNAPLARWITPIMVILVILPNFFYALSWSMLGSPTASILARASSMLGLGETLDLSIIGWPGLIIVSALKLSALAYLLLIGAFQNADRSLEDAAVMMGEPRFLAFIRITLPSLTPVLASVGALSVVIGFETFELPALLGRPAGIRPLAIQVYDYLGSGFTANYAAASTLSLIFVAIIAVLIVLQNRMTRGRDFTSVGGKARATSNIRPAAGVRGLIAVSIVLLGLISLALPTIQIVIGSFQNYFGVFDTWTTAHYVDFLTDSEIQNAVGITFLIAVFGGLLTAVIGFVLAYVMHRMRGSRLAAYVRVASWVPTMAPGIVLSVALLWTYLNTPGLRELFGTPWLFLIALMVACMPLAVRALEGSVVQVSHELDEASRISGAGPWRAMFDITFRICTPSVMAAWLLVGMLMSGRLDVPLLLQSRGSQTVATYTYSLYGNGEIAEAAAIYCGYLLLLIIAAGAVIWVATLRKRIVRNRVEQSSLKKGVELP